MRLLQFNDDGEFSLTTTFADRIPPYAIFSHTWGDDNEEIFLWDLIKATHTRKAGYNKIRFCGQQARRDGLQYFWVDTCCIDKSSSSELAEAINSMFRWYQNAAKCYVYLSDVSTGACDENHDISQSTWKLDFRQSRWFTRGWTLQELIAPTSVEFFSSDCVRLGDKRSMEQQIHEITGIPIRALRGYPLSEFSVAERLSWAENRQTMRLEDKAYSLLGIFNVYMPLIYGEGSYALQRLQEAILKSGLVSSVSSRSGMRLLVAGSDPLRIETVPVSDNLQYAILSHTWGVGEVLFDDIRNATAEQKRGYSKIRKCCNLAVKHGFDYVWVDTCCIDKSSSSELQEAICSMYKWYKNANICYVYLEDSENGNVDSLINCSFLVEELIAPTFVEFYDQTWNEIGTKQSLCDDIAKITSIDPLVLRGANPTSRTIAERMSWAAHRSTTRIEDTAYSLMGLFNVFMPMLYGEGERAFIRLQEEIIKQTEDYTIFSWKANVSGGAHRGIFAHSPAEFAAVRPERTIRKFSHPHYQVDQYPPPALTSRGLLLTPPVLSCTSDEYAYLGCVSYSSPTEDSSLKESTLLCVRLREIQSAPQVFARSSPEKLESRAVADLRHFKQQTICVLPSNVDQSTDLDILKIGEVVVYPPNDNNNVVAPMHLGSADCARWFNKDKKLTYSYQGGTGPLATIRFGVGEGFVIVIGVYDDVLWCSIVTHEDLKQQGKTLHDLKDLNVLSGSSTRHTDRAQKILSTTKSVTAAIRVAPFTDLNILRFSLHVTLLDSTTH
ncbi:hypothetical protein IFR05_005072 [Cadophora sp. M221]|nr:hypothetical protein IFR05_005072 [Cadophora sp. M221]